MRVFRNNVVGIRRDGAIHEFVIVFVHIRQQAKPIIGFTVMGHWVACDCFHHVMGDLGRSVYGEYLFIL